MIKISTLIARRNKSFKHFIILKNLLQLSIKLYSNSVRDFISVGIYDWLVVCQNVVYVQCTFLAVECKHKSLVIWREGERSCKLWEGAKSCKKWELRSDNILSVPTCSLQSSKNNRKMILKFSQTCMYFLHLQTLPPLAVFFPSVETGGGWLQL